MVENPPIFNYHLQEQVHPYYNQESKLKLQEWHKRIADKKPLITVILNQQNAVTRARIALGAFYEDAFEVAELIESLIRVHTIYNVPKPTMETYSLVLG